MQDGGPIYPIHCEYAHRSDIPCQNFECVAQGMSLRDWFAGQYLTAIGNNTQDTYVQRARFAYRMADAMIEVGRVE